MDSLKFQSCRKTDCKNQCLDLAIDQCSFDISGEGTQFCWHMPARSGRDFIALNYLKLCHCHSWIAGIASTHLNLLNDSGFKGESTDSTILHIEYEIIALIFVSMSHPYISFTLISILLILWCIDGDFHLSLFMF